MFNNLKVIFFVVGFGMDKVLKIIIYIVDIELWGKVNDIYMIYFLDYKFVCVIVLVKILYYGFLIELEVVVVVE